MPVLHYGDRYGMIVPQLGRAIEKCHRVAKTHEQLVGKNRENVDNAALPEEAPMPSAVDAMYRSTETVLQCVGQDVRAVRAVVTTDWRCL